jgi:hypothetical protein
MDKGHGNPILNNHSRISFTMSFTGTLTAAEVEDMGPGSMSIDQGVSMLSGQRNSGQSATRLRIGVTTVLGLGLLFIIIDSLGSRHVESFILEFMGWVEQNPRQGMLTMILVYVIATILFVPGSIITFGAGYAYGSAYDSKVEGVVVASTVVFIGASLGSICTFLLGRYLFRSCVVELASSYPVFQAIDRGMFCRFD